MTLCSSKRACLVRLAAFASLGAVRPALCLTLSSALPHVASTITDKTRIPSTSPLYLAGEVKGQMDTSTVEWNNLGGMGPEFNQPRSLKFANCASVGNTTLDLLIWNTTRYVTSASYRNGRGADDEYPFGLVNVECGTSVGLNYSFYVSGTDTPVIVQKLWFTFMDLDTGNRGEVKESVAIDATIKSVTLFPDSNGSELKEITSASGQAWQATVPGTGHDNPSDPMHLTQLQKRRTITFELENISDIPLTFNLTTRDDGSCPNNAGRNFVWAFKSLLVIKCNTCVVNGKGLSTCCADGGSWFGLCGSDTQLAKGVRFYSFDEGLEVCETQAPTPMPTPMATKKPRTPAPTSTTLPPASDTSCATCVIWGDPHIITFEAHKARKEAHPLREEFFRTRAWKSDQISVNEAGTFWLVSSDHVQIQGLYERDEVQNTTSLAALAIGGPFLEGNILSIRPLSAKSMWNNEQILSSVQSEFHNNLLTAMSHNAGKMVKDGSLGPALEMQLPMGVNLVVNRWHNSMAAEISLCSGDASEGVSGQCALKAEGTQAVSK